VSGGRLSAPEPSIDEIADAVVSASARTAGAVAPATGDSGLRDRVNHHYLSTFGAAAAVGLISGLAQLLVSAGIRIKAKNDALDRLDESSTRRRHATKPSSDAKRQA
jgi:hypothetical protein